MTQTNTVEMRFSAPHKIPSNSPQPYTSLVHTFLTLTTLYIILFILQTPASFIDSFVEEFCVLVVKLICSRKLLNM